MCSGFAEERTTSLYVELGTNFLGYGHPMYHPQNQLRALAVA
jgi:hypothetical protein